MGLQKETKSRLTESRVHMITEAFLSIKGVFLYTGYGPPRERCHRWSEGHLLRPRALADCCLIYEISKDYLLLE
jgi:hypothetical protein